MVAGKALDRPLGKVVVDLTSVAIFIAITFGLGWWCLIVLRGLGATFPMRAALAMFAPAAAALITTWIRGQTWRDLGLGFKLDRSYLYGYLLPPVLVVAGIALSLASGYQHWAVRGDATDRVVWQSALALTIGTGVNCVFTLGEELGWRGYLLPRLVPLGGPVAAVVVGVVWGLWHAPTIALDGYEFGVSSWLLAPLFCLYTVPVGVIMAWLRWRSANIWPAVIMHAGINAFSGLWLLVLSPPANSLIGSPVGLFGILPIAIFATWLIAAGRVRPREGAPGAVGHGKVPRPAVALRVGTSLAILAGLLGATAVTGLVAGAKVLQGSARFAVFAYSEPEVDNLMSGYQAADYSRASRDFDPILKTGLDQSTFDHARVQIEAEFGSYVSRTVDHVEDRGDSVTVYYHAHFSKRDALMTVSLHATTPHRISGWFVRAS